MSFDIGISQEELREQIISRAVEKIADDIINDRYEDVVAPVQKTLEEHRKAAIDKAVAAVVDPFFQTKVEELVFQKTNEWGEKSGCQQTFREFVIARADHYINEPVDYSGKPKGSDSYNWSAKTTRIAYAIDSNLQHRIDTAMKEALKDANSVLANGIAGAVKVSLAGVLAKLQVTATVK